MRGRMTSRSGVTKRSHSGRGNSRIEGAAETIERVGVRTRRVCLVYGGTIVAEVASRERRALETPPALSDAVGSKPPQNIAPVLANFSSTGFLFFMP